MNKFNRIRKSLSFNIISAITALLLVFGIIVTVIGYVSFTNTLKREYETTTYHMANTATSLVDGNLIDDYLDDEELTSYNTSYGYLKKYCNYMDVTLIHVFTLDQDNYLDAKNVFNVVNDKELEDGNYSEWERGFGFGERFTRSYKEVYEQIYNNEIEYGTVFRTKDLRDKEPHLTTIVPVKNDSGDIVAILTVQRPMSELVNGRRPYIITILISTVALIIFIGIVAGLYLKFQFVKPLKEVTGETKAFAKDNKKTTDLSKKKYKILEISELGNSVNQMEDEMLDYIEKITTIASERERISTELNIASAIQENSIPNQFPAFPERLDFDIFASMTPAKEVGGDFYNFSLIDDDHLALIIADVSGKGIPAALFMMVTNILITERLSFGESPSVAIESVNERICRRNVLNMFVTMWVGVLELSTGTLKCANAGHNDPAVYRKNGSFELIKFPHGLVVGAMSGIKYVEKEIKLEKGDKIFAYTDGVFEAIDKDNKLYGMDLLVKNLNFAKDLNPEGIVNYIKNSVFEYAGLTPQFDDMTMLCVELKDKSQINKIIVDAKLENLDKVIDYTRDTLVANGCLKNLLTPIELAIEELFVNICNYAYVNNNGPFEIVINVENDIARMVISDKGLEFNPLEKKDPDITLNADEREVGGLGIFLVKKTMDSVNYSYTRGMNILVLTKKIK